ncbi:hypothetical protein SRABI128_05844 [Microbacterium sp. Bi128]|nr:hypothetical protein SRABI128_05844 [Microbacterium sp. Bi128]
MDAVQGVDLLQAPDAVARPRGVGVVFGGHDDGDGRVLGPAQRLHLVQLALGRCHEQPAEGRLEPGEDGLGFGIAEPDVEFDDPRAARGQGEADEEDADKRGAAVRHLVDRGLGDAVDHFLHEAFGGPLQRCVRAHAAGVGALVVVEDALEVLRRGQGHGVGAVAKDEHGDLGSVQELLDHHGAARVEAGLGMREGLVPVGGDHDALAGREPVVLDDVRGAEGIEGVGGFPGIGGNAGHCGGHAGLGHDFLGEGLGRFQLGRGLAGAEDRDAGGADGVGHAGGEGRLRTDHHQVNGELEGQRRDGVGIVRVDRICGDQRADAGVARGRVDLGNVRVCKQGSDNGVFAAAGADDKYLHSLQGYVVHPAGS